MRERENSIPDLPQPCQKVHRTRRVANPDDPPSRAQGVAHAAALDQLEKFQPGAILYSVPTPRAYTNNSRVAAPEPTELIGTDRNGSERTRPDRNGCETLGWQGMPSGKNGHHPGSWKPSQRSYPRLIPGWDPTAPAQKMQMQMQMSTWAGRGVRGFFSFSQTYPKHAGLLFLRLGQSWESWESSSRRGRLLLAGLSLVFQSVSHYHTP